jgi:hypothetical protein
VAREGLVDRGGHLVGQAELAELDDRVEVVAERAEVADLLS